MVCNKLIKEAFEGIEFRYKLDDTLTDLGEQKFTAKQLEGYLTGKGVSPKEIKQSGLLKGFESDNRAIPASEWLSRSGSQRLSTTTLKGGEYGSTNFDNISLGAKGVDNETYKETLTGIASPKTNIPSEPHFNNQLPNVPNPKEIQAKEAVDKYIAKEQSNGRVFIDILNDTEYKKLSSELKSASLIPDKSQSLLGWRRTHVDDINGKKTLVLNEFQSDWAQTERAGRGTFESNSGPDILSKIARLEKEQEELFDKARDAWLKENNLTLQQAYDKVDDGEIEFADEVYAFQEKYFSADANRTSVIFQELDILDRKSRNNKVVADFPMSELKHHQFQIVGAIDDAIKQGIDTVAIPIQRENELMGSAGVTKFYESLNTKILPDIRKKLEKQGLKISVSKKPYKGGKIADKQITNELWTLTIDELPNTKVKWDVYGLIGSLGLAGYVNKEGEQ